MAAKQLMADHKVLWIYTNTVYTPLVWLTYLQAVDGNDGRSGLLCVCVFVCVGMLAFIHCSQQPQHALNVIEARNWYYGCVYEN